MGISQILKWQDFRLPHSIIIWIFLKEQLLQVDQSSLGHYGKRIILNIFMTLHQPYEPTIFLMSWYWMQTKHHQSTMWQCHDGWTRNSTYTNQRGRWWTCYSSKLQELQVPNDQKSLLIWDAIKGQGTPRVQEKLPELVVVAVMVPKIWHICYSLLMSLPTVLLRRSKKRNSVMISPP